MLFHCDERWQVIVTSGAETVEAIKARAEKNYPGVSARWIDLNVSPEEVLSTNSQEASNARSAGDGRSN